MVKPDCSEGFCRERKAGNRRRRERGKIGRAEVGKRVRVEEEEWKR